jgi:Rad3-related DNA helicase
LQQSVIHLDRYETDVQKIRQSQRHARLLSKVRMLVDGLREGGWVYCGGKKDRNLSFKPVVVNGLGKKFLWPLAENWLLMSASIISAEALLGELGWEDDFEYVTVGSGFPVESRKIKVTPLADMSRNANEREQLVDGVRAIIQRHPGERILIHSVSYDLTRYLRENIPGSIGYYSAGDRSSALAAFRRKEGGILIAPSFDRGVDFPDDQCRIVIVAKVPFPYLGDKQVSSRLYARGGQLWYSVLTVRSLVQMTGRATRHEKDWSVSYILDKQFVRLWETNRRVFPQWWVDALDWRDNLAQTTSRVK